MTKKYLYQSLLLFITTFAIDRITKYWAHTTLTESYSINQFLSFDLAYNRGIAWSLFYTDQNTGFMMLTGLIALIIGGLTCHTIIRWANHQPITGEILVLSGAYSNLIDRFIYPGVIDFIHLSYSSLSWPIFNLADLFIVLGVGIILITHYKQ